MTPTYMGAVVDAHLYQLAVLQVHDAVVGKLPVPVLIEFHAAGHPIRVLGRHEHPGQGGGGWTFQGMSDPHPVSLADGGPGCQHQMDSTAGPAKQLQGAESCSEGFFFFFFQI